MRHPTFLFVATLISACQTGTTGDDTDVPDTDATVDGSDDTDAADTDATVDGSDDTDVEVDTDLVPAVTAAQLAGVFTGNSPTEACYADILSGAVIEVTEEEGGQVGLFDGTNGARCDIVGDTLVCGQISNASPVSLGGDVNCTWPYTVDLTVTSVSEDGFDLALQLQTSTASGPAACAQTLGACSGSGSATFTRFSGQGAPPAAAAMVKASD